MCPHCGFELAHADRAYGAVPLLNHELTDLAGVLNKHERARVSAAIAQAERPFPQVHFAVVISKFQENAPLRAITFWIFNRGELSSPFESGAACRLVLFVLDATANRASCMAGYGLEPFLPGEKLAQIVQSAQTALSRGDYANAVIAMVKNAVMVLKSIAVTLPQNKAANANAVSEMEGAFVY